MADRRQILRHHDFRARIKSGLAGATAQRARSSFNELNPHLKLEKIFPERPADFSMRAAVLVPLVERASGPNVVMTVRTQSMPSHAGQIAFPGGKVDPRDKDVVAAALREAHEEVNIPPEAVDVVGALGAHVGGIGFSITPVIGIVDLQTEFRPCPREVEEIFEVPLEFIADIANHVIEEQEHNGMKYYVYAAPYDRFYIWGLTASILRTLAEMLQENERLS